MDDVVSGEMDRRKGDWEKNRRDGETRDREGIKVFE